MLKQHAPLVVTPGDPAGIGPDIVLQFAQQHPDISFVAIVDKNILAERAKQLGIHSSFNPYVSGKSINGLHVLHVDCDTPITAGITNSDSSHYILKTLTIAAQGCLDNTFSAMITGPVHKTAINNAGITFSGHTEYLAQATSAEHPVMMLMTDTLKVALMTTHIPLAKVPKAITPNLIKKTIAIVHTYFQQHFNIQQPRILVLGLNPHAGDGGHIGKEEQDIIIPTLNQLREQGYDVSGPASADTAFNTPSANAYDVIVAMYHDQGLPVIKYSGFKNAVNITLGLPIIRTSVDHGTAYSLAGTGRADIGSFNAAMTLADRLSADKRSGVTS